MKRNEQNKTLSREDVIAILKKESVFLSEKYGVKKIGLFGSFAREEQNMKSDVDIVVELSRPIGLKFVELADYLEESLGRKVDILTPDGVEGIRIKSVANEIKRNIVYV
ncbi:MAG: nucleotidyltransferase family protein [Nitrospirae bacterium]|nr:nucleotidyltransferase family protein [Nitrospirota bacterium]